MTTPPPPRSTLTRVLVFIDSGTASGPVKQLAATIRPLRQAGVELHCISFQRRGQPAITSPAYLAEHGASVDIIQESGVLDVRLIASVADMIRRHKPDIIQTHGYRPSVLLALLSTVGLARAPWIGFFHGRTTESWRVVLYDKLDHLALRRSDVTVVMSNLQKREKAGYRRASVRVVYNAVINSAPASPSAAEPPSLGGPWPRPVIGVIGRLSPEKGVDVMLQAWARLVERGHDGTLVLAGDGQERERLEQLAETLHVTERCRFLGHLDAPDQLYPLLDLMVIPSRTEGLPNVFLEALRHGVRVVSTRVGAIPDLVGDSTLATLVDIEDPTALATAIADSLAYPEAVGTTAAASALLHSLSLPARVDALAQIYREVLARTPVS